MKAANDEEWMQFASLLSYQSVDFSNSDSFDALRQSHHRH